MNKIHIPLKLNPYERKLLCRYHGIFKHSPISVKMLLCAYYGATYGKMYITFETYLSYCINYYTKETQTQRDPDYTLMTQWDIAERWKTHFFGFEVQKIREGSVADVEKMVTDLYVEYKQKHHNE